MKFYKFFTVASSGIFLSLVATSALAGRIVNDVPEPGILPLLSLGGVVLAAAIIRNRRNKK